MNINIYGVYFTVKDVDKSIEYYKKLLDIEPFVVEKYINKDITYWAEFGLENGMHFGLINENAMEEKRKFDNNAVLNLYANNLQDAYKKVKELGFKILYEPTKVEDRPYNYERFTIYRASN